MTNDSVNPGHETWRIRSEQECGIEEVEREARASNMHFEPVRDGASVSEACRIGLHYFRGDGVQRGELNARRYFQHALEEDGCRSVLASADFLRQEGKGADALSLYTFAAQEGASGEAYLRAASLLFSGKAGLTANAEAAFDMLQKAEMNIVDRSRKAFAQKCIAHCLWQGKGTPKDVKTAIVWFSKAIEVGNDIKSVIALAFCYQEISDHSSALTLLERANRSGYGPAGIFAGDLLSKNEGVPEDRARAAMNYQIAASWGEKMGFVLLGKSHERGEGVEKNGPRALFCYETAAMMKSPEGAYFAGIAYFRGECGLVEPNKEKANCYFSQCRQLGYGPGTACLGRSLRDGEGVSQDASRALDLFCEAGIQKFPQGFAEAGVIYEKGAPGVPQDIARANACYKRAAEEGSSLGYLYYGLNLEAGRGMDVDMAEAFRYYKKAYELGCSRATTCLGVMLLHGYGCNANPDAAVSLFRISAKEGERRGARNLQLCYALGICAR